MVDVLAWFDSEVQKLAERLGDAYERPTATAILATRRVLVWTRGVVGHDPTEVVPFDAGGLAVEFVNPADGGDFVELRVESDGTIGLLRIANCQLVSRQQVVWADGLGWRMKETEMRLTKQDRLLIRETVKAIKAAQKKDAELLRKARPGYRATRVSAPRPDEGRPYCPPPVKDVPF